MKQIKTEIIINSSKEKIWAVISDFASYDDWNSIITGVKGKMVVGSGFRFKIDIYGFAVPMPAEVQRADENQYFGWGNDYESFLRFILAAHHYFEIIEISDTQCKFVHGENFYGIIPWTSWKLIEPMGAQYDIFNAALKNRVENA